MIVINGLATSVVKLQLESVLNYNLGLIHDVGSFLSSGPGSGTFTANSKYTLPASGQDLVIRANTNIFSATDIVVTVTGLDQTSGALTGTATIKANAAEGQAYQVIPGTSGKLFKTVTSIAITNGVLGDGFDISVLPDSANDVPIAFDQGLTTNPGKEVKGIYRKYNLDHTKRIRGDRTITIGSFYTNNYEGVAAIHNRVCTLVQRFYDNGRQTATESVWIDQAQLGVVRESPASEDSEVTAKGEGIYGRLFIFS